MSITAVILAGGRGSRMGGIEKGLLDWRGRLLIAHLIETLAPQVDHIVINANRAHERYTAFGLPIIQDTAAFAGCGPLAGLHAALSHSRETLVVCVPCDLPGVPPDLVTRLLDAALSCPTQPPLAYAACAGRAWPTLCLAHTSWREPLETSLSLGHFAAWRWFVEHGACVADLGDTPLANFNTHADLRSGESQIDRCRAGVRAQ